VLSLVLDFLRKGNHFPLLLQTILEIIAKKISATTRAAEIPYLKKCLSEII